MSTGYQIKDQEALHHLTLQVVDWIDIFTRKAYSNPFIHEKLTYLHNNPVRAGIVERPEEYLYSSAT